MATRHSENRLSPSLGGRHGDIIGGSKAAWKLKKSIRMRFMLGTLKSAELKFTPYLMSVSLLLIGKRIPDPFDLLHNPLNAQVC